MKYIAFAFASAIALSGACAAGSITGTVNGSDGSGITAGVVTARFAATAVSSRPGSGIMSSEIQSDGTFQFPSLAQGVYTVCTEAPLTVWLSSCEWGNNGATVSLTED